MAHVISVVNQKGGVGKTTTALNLATYLAHHGKFVLLLDLDPQGNASSGIGIDIKALDKTLYECMVSGESLKNIVLNIPHGFPQGLKVAPSGIDLAGANIELISHDTREYKLRDLLLEIRHDFDFIIIDSPPSLGLLTINGLVASEEILIPIQCEYFALEGLGQLLNTIELVKQNLNPDLNVLGAVLTMYDTRANLSEAVLQELYKHFPNKIFRSVIPRNIRLAEAPSHGKSILHYDDKSRGARAYERLAKEIMELKKHN